MSEDKNLDSVMQNLDEMMDSKIASAETSMKKATVHAVLFAVATTAIYFIWGTTWYFWVSLVITAIIAIPLTIGGIMINKSKKKLESMR